MKLYYSPNACSLSPHIVLSESGLEFDIEKVDLKTKMTQSGKDFTQINPKGYVPVLECENGHFLTEGPAILQYIADKVPDKNLAPVNGSFERYRLQEALNYIGTEIHKNFSMLFSSSVPDVCKQMAKDNLSKRFAHLDKHLSHNDFVMGKNFTVADAYLFTVLRWSRPMKIDLTSMPALEKFLARIEQRPAVQAALEAETKA
jgi:glutathione S-transferase